MIVYFASRQLSILGHASTGLRKGFVIIDDEKTEDVETGVATFSCEISFDKESQLLIEEMVEVGNYVLRSNGDEQECYTIIDTEIDTERQTAYIYAEDQGLDLLNEVVGEFEATEAHTAEWYINMYALDGGFEIGTNDIPSTILRQLSWTERGNATERLADIAKQFGGYEISFSFEISGLAITKRYINIHEKRGSDSGEQLRLNIEVDRIVTKKTVSNLATELVCIGGTPENATEPINLYGYTYDDGDFYIDGTSLKSRNAFEKWGRFNGGHIAKLFEDEALTQGDLCKNAVAKLKEVCDMEVNYEADIPNLPDNIKVGDRVNLIDDAGGLYVSTRLLMLKTSITQQQKTVTFGDHIIKTSGISQKVSDLAAQFAKQTISVQRAKAIAQSAKTVADAAQGQANAAAAEAQNAKAEADEAKAAANTATQSAAEATEKANDAQAAVDIVENSVSSLQTTIENAQAAANNAHTAAENAQTKANEAKAAAEKAEQDAADAKAAVGTAQETADSAISNAAAAAETAGQAKAAAEAAQAEAASARADAEQAEKDVEAFGETLETAITTMDATYTRKTEFTETQAQLQSQITQNAEGISSTNSKLLIIDETANNAADLAGQAQSAAASAQQLADRATADAAAAQTAADAAAAAATAAQSEADTAKAAAEAAQRVADKAEEDLETAKADLATVAARVDATEEEITAAQAAVTTAQAAADKAKADAAAAAQTAADAQSTADTAVTNASTAKAAADEAANKANLAQQTANEAKGNAAEAKAIADAAAEAAATAQATAETAKTNATNAQATADAAAKAAADAQTAADNADAKAAQAATDLATAQQNLADVQSRVGATEEEVAAAQAAVETAKAAADKAKSDAVSAQATADAAKADAAIAQAAADSAKEAADNAQAEAEAAKAAAAKAQEDVNALAIRVTSAETEISKTAEEIKLLATKAEVTQTLGGYYTKSETDAAISVKSDAIISNVTAQIAEIEVGARNLLPGTDFDGVAKRYERLEGYTTEGGFHFFPTTDIESGTEYTISANIRGNANIVFYEINDGGNVSHFWIKRDELDITEYRRFSLTFSVRSGHVFNDAYICTQWGDTNTLVGDWFEIEGGSLKLEKGNKATDWTPAPEDLQSIADMAQNTADGLVARVEAAETTIQQLADSIAMLVRSGESGTLVKQDANGFYYFDISEIEKNIEATATEVDSLSGIVLDANGEIDVLKSTANALMERTEYVRSYTDDNDNPCLELGEGDSQYRVYITNTGIRFEDDTEVPTTISRQVLIIEKAIVRNELQFGDEEQVDGVWSWKRRENGNLGLSWKDVTI